MGTEKISVYHAEHPANTLILALDQVRATHSFTSPAATYPVDLRPEENRYRENGPCHGGQRKGANDHSNFVVEKEVNCQVDDS